MDQDKRLYRQLKRIIKRKGSKHRRRQLQRELQEHPDEAPFSEADNFGRSVSADFNGLDQDATRRRTTRQED